MTRPCELIILHATRYGDNAFVVHTLCRELGKKSFLVRGVGKKVSPAWFLQFNIIEADITQNGKSSLAVASHFSQKEPLTSLRESPGKNCIALFLSEVLLKTLQEGEVDEDFYAWLRGRILLLDSLGSASASPGLSDAAKSGVGYTNFHIALLKELCEKAGYRTSQQDLLIFSEDTTLPDLEKLEGKSFEETLLVPLTGRRRDQLIRTYLKYLEYHLDTPLHIQSLDVLAALF